MGTCINIYLHEPATLARLSYRDHFEDSVIFLSEVFCCLHLDIFLCAVILIRSSNLAAYWILKIQGVVSLINRC